jgi:hypothetical protein
MMETTTATAKIPLRIRTARRWSYKLIGDILLSSGQARRLSSRRARLGHSFVDPFNTFPYLYDSV